MGQQIYILQHRQQESRVWENKRLERESSKGTGGEARKRAQKNLERGRATQAGEVGKKDEDGQRKRGRISIFIGKCQERSKG